MKHSENSHPDSANESNSQNNLLMSSDSDGSSGNSKGSSLNNLELDFSLANLRRRKTIRISLLVSFVLLIFWFIPPVYKLYYGSVTVTRWDRKLGETRAEVGPGRRGWIKAAAISKHVLHAFVAAEDGKFYFHSGFDLEEIAKSIQTNMKKQRYARGASTISQQVVKMAFLSREKSLLRKAREAVGTVLMEAILPKDRILEWYINLAEFGDGVYGIAEGCQHYFKTKPEQLTIEQSVHLALVLPSPNSWSRGLRDRNLTPFGHKRYASILNNMKLSGYITKGQWQTALSRGDFGRPIHGYNKYIANEDKISNDCTIEECGETETDPVDDPVNGPVNEAAGSVELQDKAEVNPLQSSEILTTPLESSPLDEPVFDQTPSESQFTEPQALEPNTEVVPVPEETSLPSTEVP